MKNRFMDATATIGLSFHRQASQYDSASVIQQEIGKRLCERLRYVKKPPATILDLGCGTGACSAWLKKQYPKALIIGLDLAQGMLMESRKKQRLWRSWSLIQSDMLQLPLASNSIDLIFANQVLHWSSSLPTVLMELNRVLSQDGCLQFTTLGPDTFKEIKTAWQQAGDAFAHVNPFLDMHDLGDCLIQQSFADPVLDMEFIALNYPNLKSLLQHLKAQGVKNIHQARNHALTGKTTWQRFEKAYTHLCTPEGKYPLTYEVIYGHAWKGRPKQEKQGIETYVPLSALTLKPL